MQDCYNYFIFCWQRILLWFLVIDQIDAQFFLCVYFNSVHVSSNLVLIIRRINCISTTSGICHSVSVTVSTKRSPTQSDIYQMLYWYNWFSWWWARGCSKHVENWNKHTEKNCASSWSFTKNVKIIFLSTVCHNSDMFRPTLIIFRQYFTSYRVARWLISML